ncbi:MAG: hypothetical protein WDN26_15040 [Chitinophagaceae bacterium]
MKKDTIVQFICFVTNLEFEEFVKRWEPISKQIVSDGDSMLQEAAPLKGKNKFKFVLQHECGTKDFKFAFIKGKNQENFPEHRARIVQAGGYTAIQVQRQNIEMKNDVKVIAFIDHSETDIDFYNKQTYRHLNIYQAYYESCAYSYVMEYFLPEQDAPALLEQLKTRTGIEATVYRECPVLQS